MPQIYGYIRLLDSLLFLHRLAFGFEDTQR